MYYNKIPIYPIFYLFKGKYRIVVIPDIRKQESSKTTDGTQRKRKGRQNVHAHCNIAFSKTSELQGLCNEVDSSTTKSTLQHDSVEAFAHIKGRETPSRHVPLERRQYQLLVCKRLDDLKITHENERHAFVAEISGFETSMPLNSLKVR